jgi:hypothetical protein
MTKLEADRLEIHLEAGGCPLGRHNPHMQACTWRADQPCRCRGEVALHLVQGGGVAE